ncbi:hypothetical protein KIW84_013321 [Lathyrus oleraceus]|uniref:Aspartate/glutamate/uridylate kinase domain-containing protein n=1 Tax=Pisum sativum TaxID=3888 RepID=A0A9D5BK19_PEA|nr:hypothetical protein KIW84_013321 [Pisum sativum]
MHQISFGGYTIDSLIPNTNNYQVLANQPYTLNQIKEQLVAMNNGLTIIETCISNDVGVSGFKLADEDFVDTDELSTDSSSLATFSNETESVAARSKLQGFTSNNELKLIGEITEEKVPLKSERGIIIQLMTQNQLCHMLRNRPKKNTEIVILLNNARKVDRARTCGDDLFESDQFTEACSTYGDGFKVYPFEFCPVSQYSSMLVVLLSILELHQNYKVNLNLKKQIAVEEIENSDSCVMKFGGSSVANAVRMKEVANLILNFPEERPIILLSATGKTTNRFLLAGEKAVSCGVTNVDSIDELSDIKDLHLRTVEELGVERDGTQVD